MGDLAGRAAAAAAIVLLALSPGPARAGDRKSEIDLSKLPYFINSEDNTEYITFPNGEIKDIDGRRPRAGSVVYTPDGVPAFVLPSGKVVLVAGETEPSDSPKPRKRKRKTRTVVKPTIERTDSTTSDGGADTKQSPPLHTPATTKEEDDATKAGGAFGATIKIIRDVSEQLVTGAVTTTEEDKLFVAERSMESGDAANTESLTTKVLETKPDDATAYALRSSARLKAGDEKRAREDALAAVRFDPANERAKSTLRDLETREALSRVSDSRGLEAAKSMARTQGQAPQESNPDPAGTGNAAQGRDQAAAPGAGRALAMRASAKLGMKDYAGAAQDASRAIALNPRLPDAFNMRAAARNMLGDYAGAAADATASIALIERNKPAYDARALAFLRLGRWREAIADADRALAIDPRDADALFLRAQAHERLGDFKAMMRDLREAARADRRYREAYARAGQEHNLPVEPLELDAPAGMVAGGSSGAMPLPGDGRRGPPWGMLAAAAAGALLLAAGLARLFRKSWTARLKAAAAPAPRPASRLEESYELKGAIGRGGMGIVYEALDRSLDRRVAVKMMRDELKGDARERERFIAEARTVAALRHPAIVAIHAILDDGDDLCIVFEFVEGETLDALLARKGRLSLDEAKRILGPVCGALEFAHGRRVIHRDLKPSNVMVAPSGEVKVMDFGIARRAKDSLARLSMTNTVMGTPLYMAPEAERGVVCRESDIFSLAALAYELLTGSPPFPAPATAAVKSARAYPKPSKAAPSLPPGVDALIDAGLEPDHQKRIASAAEFWKRFAAL